MNDSPVRRPDERAGLLLRELYHQHGYQSYRMSKFEPYDLYARNKSFLVSENILTFTDTDGRLMALKPDVTLSIIKNIRPSCQVLEKVYYHENVYRTSPAAAGYREIMQTGLECIGALDLTAMGEVVALAAESLSLLSGEYLLDLGHMGLVSGLLGEQDNLEDGIRMALLAELGRKNAPAIRDICSQAGLGHDLAERLYCLSQLYGCPAQVLPRLKELGGSREARTALEELEGLCRILERLDLLERVRLDFSIVNDMRYYNGVIFRGYLPGLASGVLAGGRYDHLLRRMGHRLRGLPGPAGTAGGGQHVRCGRSAALQSSGRSRRRSGAGPGADSGGTLRPRGAGGPPAAAVQGTDPLSGRRSGLMELLNIALPKGRLGEKVYTRFKTIGYPCPSIEEENRKLIFENPEAGVRYFWVKPSDVAIYVERGAADIGVAGKDILLEYAPDVYELADLGLGKCRMCVAAKKDFRDRMDRVLRVATKFPHIAGEYYASLSREIDIIHLNGSIEIAPILGLSDVIVDIVETGKTLLENDLEPKETIVPISARLIANKVGYKFKHQQITELCRRMETLPEKG